MKTTKISLLTFLGAAALIFLSTAGCRKDMTDSSTNANSGAYGSSTSSTNSNSTTGGGTTGTTSSGTSSSGTATGTSPTPGPNQPPAGGPTAPTTSP